MPAGMIRTKRTECWISPSLTVRHSSSEPVMRPVILHHLLLKLCMVLMCQERKKAKQSLHGAPHCGPMKTTREPDLPVGLQSTLLSGSQKQTLGNPSSKSLQNSHGLLHKLLSTNRLLQLHLTALLIHILHSSQGWYLLTLTVTIC